MTGWWFGTWCVPYIGNNDPNWLIFFRGAETTNQLWIRWFSDGNLDNISNFPWNLNMVKWWNWNDLGLLKVIFYFPNGKSTMTGESISESFWMFFGGPYSKSRIIWGWLSIHRKTMDNQDLHGFFLHRKVPSSSPEHTSKIAKRRSRGDTWKVYYIYIPLYIYMYVYVYICMYIYIYMYMCVCMYMFVYTYDSPVLYIETLINEPVIADLHGRFTGSAVASDCPGPRNSRCPQGGHGCHRGQMAETTWGRWEMVDLEDSYGENLRLYWLVVWNMNFMTFHFLEIIIVIPTDFHIFQRGWNHQPV